MPIRVTCNHCGKQFSAWDDLLGKSVQCPKCHQRMVVPKTGSVGSSPPSEKRRPSQSARGTSAPASPGKPAATPSPRSRGIAPPLPKEAPRSQHPVASRPAPTATTTSRVKDEFDDSDALPIVCPNCRQTMPAAEDLCDRCGYHKILKKVIDMEGVVRRDGSTGFERAVKPLLRSDESTEGTLFWFKILAGFVIFVTLLVCLGDWFWIGALLLAGGYTALYYKLRREENSAVNQDPVSAVAWHALLTLQRLLRWRRLEWPFPAVRALTIRDTAFDDRDLSELDNLEDIGAVDLEGTDVSNGGLTYLADLRGLEFLVLRKTKVTDDGIRRLQQKLRSTWIWY